MLPIRSNTSTAPTADGPFHLPPPLARIVDQGAVRTLQAQSQRGAQTGREDKNDRNLIVSTLGLALCGILFGVITSSSTVGALIAGFVYGTIGAATGAHLAFAFSVLRRFRR